jgi:hypothetical protein
MNWIHANQLLFGLLADSLTFLGGCLLARDAFLRLRELRRSRIDVEFRRRFPGVNLSDEELAASVKAMAWTVAGFLLLALGFLCQLLLRAAEAAC